MKNQWNPLHKPAALLLAALLLTLFSACGQNTETPPVEMKKIPIRMKQRFWTTAPIEKTITAPNISFFQRHR